MLLRQVLSLTCELKAFSKALWGILCIMIIITTVVMLSRYTCDASNLRNWRNETNDYVQITVNESTLQKFLQFLNSSSSSNDKTSNDSSNTGLRIGVSIPLGNTTGRDDEENNESCKPLPPRDDFSKCGNRIADRKCCEYIWAWKYKDDLMEHSKCVSSFGIIGGSRVNRGEFPHMVAVGYELKAKKGQYGYMCGGTLISDRFVLTAGHCTKLGESYLYELTPAVIGLAGVTLKEMMTVKIDKIFKHEKYAPPRYDYDVGLLKLWDTVVFTYSVHPACLSTELYPRYTEVNVTGWGTTDSKDKTRMSDDLRVATVKTVAREQCGPLIRNTISKRHLKQLRRHHLCAGLLTGRADTCQGDSGGPLQVRINTTYGNIHRVIGVTSFGRGCATHTPGVYVSVSAVITWIERIVWPKQEKDYYEGI